MLSPNLISRISNIMEDGGLSPSLSSFLSSLLHLPLSAIPIKACTFVRLEFDSIIPPCQAARDELCHGDPSCLLQR